ncbi:MAG: hypothetical protein ABI718_17680, partial [Acidobacteriota bacterium]
MIGTYSRLVLLACLPVLISSVKNDVRKVGKGETVIAVYGNRAERFEQAQSIREGSDEVWLWTENSPPVRSSGASNSDIGKLPPPLRTLHVTQQACSKREAKAGALIIAAPTTMWQSVPESLLPRFELSNRGTQ